MEVTSNIKYLPADITEYVVDGQDGVINVDTSINAITIILPNIYNSGFANSTRGFIINDISGNASVKNITITAIGNTTNGSSNVVINQNDGSANCSISNLTEWFIIVEPSTSGTTYTFDNQPTPGSTNPVTSEGIYAWTNSNFAPIGSAITVVANFAALPAPATVPNKFYFAENSQGIKWIGALFGGNYYPAGTYYSNGVAWKYTENPYQATQAGVDDGIITDQFVSPETLKNASQWNTKEDFITGTGNNRDFFDGTKNFASLPVVMGQIIDESTTTAPSATQYVPAITDTAEIVKMKWTDIFTFLVTPTSIGAFINSLTNKPTPLDADEIGFVDNDTATPIEKKVTFNQSWTNYYKVKADLLYQPKFTVLGVTSGGTGLSTIALGSVLAANSLNTVTAITSTTGNKGLINDSGVISWSTVTGTGAPVRAISPSLTTPDIGVATGTSIALSSLTSTRIVFSGASGLLSDDSAYTWDNTNKRLKVGTVANIVNGDFNITKSTAGSGSIISIENTGTGNSYAQFALINSSTQFAAVSRWSSAYTGNHGGTTIPLASTLYISNTIGTQDGTGPLSILGSAIYNLAGQTSTNYGTKLDINGFRVDTLTNLNTSNTVPFQVGSNLKYVVTTTVAGGVLQLGGNSYTARTGLAMTIGSSAFYVTGDQVVSGFVSLSSETPSSTNYFISNGLFSGSYYTIINTQTTAGFISMRGANGSDLFILDIANSRMSLNVTGGTIIGGSGTSLSTLEVKQTAASRASWLTTGIHFSTTASSYTINSTGTKATAVMNSFGIDTINGTTATVVTDAATLYIAGVPIQGTAITLTNSWALWVAAGKSKFGGNIELTQTVTTEALTSDTSVTMVINGTTYKLLAKA